MTKTRRSKTVRARLETAIAPERHGAVDWFRLTLGAGALALLTVLALLIAWIAAPDNGSDDRQGAGSSHAAAPSTAATGPKGPPRTRDPLEYGREFAQRLWSYDTRTDTQSGHVTALLGWLTDETEYADPGSVTAQIPDPVLWSRMRDGGQYATATVSEAHIPASFTAALNEDPGRITTAYAYAVTVTGKQQIRWNGTGPDTAGSGAEDRAVTLAVQCRPNRDCALIGITPGIAP